LGLGSIGKEKKHNTAASEDRGEPNSPARTTKQGKMPTANNHLEKKKGTEVGGSGYFRGIRKVTPPYSHGG